MLPNWDLPVPQWTDDALKLLTTNGESSPNQTDLSTILEKSENFPQTFPTDTVRCKTLESKIDHEILERNINSAYPILHENIVNFCVKFILFKRQYGTKIEREFYKTMNFPQFIERLLTKRAATFVGKHDCYTLLNGEEGIGKWETIGTAQEKSPLLLKDYLSYDEIKLSVFLSVSSYTYFINVGDRRNRAIFSENREKIQDEGIIIGIIGPRLVKQQVMEYQELVINKQQNNKSNGYGEMETPTIHQLFAEFYEENCIEFDDMIEDPRYIPLPMNEFFDTVSYSKRLVFSIDTLLIEANHRALERDKSAYVHVVGIGLGVWQKTPHQHQIFLDTCVDRIKKLGSKLHNVSDVCFAYIPGTTCGGYKHGDKIQIDNHPNDGIRIYLCKREPHEKLDDNGKLLVVSYAWDGNSLPGNEFWFGNLSGSSDSAAASSTQISELHNPFINPIVGCGNLRIATRDGRVVTFDEYRQQLFKEREIKRKTSE